MAHPDPADQPRFWTGLVDDAAIFPPGNADLPEAAARATSPGRHARTPTWSARSCCATPTCPSWPRAPGVDLPVSVVVTGGAGQIAGPARACRAVGLTARRARDRAARPRRPGRQRPPGRGRGRRRPRRRRPRRGRPGLRRAAARASRPTGGWPPRTRWPRAELRLKFRTGGVEADLFPAAPTRWPRWIDAALDRETPFKCTAGLHHARAPHADEGIGPSSTTASSTCCSRRAPAFDGAPTRPRSWRTLERARRRRAGGRGPSGRPGRRPALVHVVRLLLGQRTARRPDHPRTARSRR